jgi:hypothetical protein
VTGLQGGLPAAGRGPGAVIEIACDESGFSGTNLLDAATPMFTHASVDLSADEAGQLIAGLRSRLRGSPTELKSARLRRGSESPEALAWFLEALHDRAHVLLIDKEYFLVTRVVDLFLVEPSYAAGTRLTEDDRAAALALHRAGRAAGRAWSDFLNAFVDLVRTRRQRGSEGRAVDQFLRVRDSLARTGLGQPAEDVLGALTRRRVRAVVNRLADGDRSIPPPLEPLLPALAETVLFWSDGHREVLVVHDEQSALTADRLTRLQQVLAAAGDWSPTSDGVSPLAGLVTVDSRDDPRVQVADLLAGVARRSKDDGCNELLERFLSPTSLLAPGR